MPLVSLLTITGCASGAHGPAADPTRLEAQCRSYAAANNPDIQPARRISGALPSSADFAGQSGSACVRVTITPSGSVIDPQVVQTDNDAFSRAVVKALADWRYEPATRGSAKVTYHTTIFARLPG